MRGGLPALLPACRRIDTEDHPAAARINAREERFEMGAAGGGGCGCHLFLSPKAASILAMYIASNSRREKARRLSPPHELVILKALAAPLTGRPNDARSPAARPAA